MSLVISKVFTYDTDAGNYIQAVEAADGQALEAGTRQAINNFVIGCKQDGIWSAIKASCILAGARRKEGAFIDLKSATQILTNNSFVDGDYNRKTGIQAGGSGKTLDAGISNDNASYGTQNNKHIAVYVTQKSANFSRTYVAGGNTAIAVATSLSTRIGSSLNSSSTNTADTHEINGTTFPLIGLDRPGSANYTLRALGKNLTITTAATSATPTFGNYAFFYNGTNYTTCKLAFYSIGESLDLALLDARITALINAFAAAIP